MFAQMLSEPATLRGESPQTRKRLAEAEQKVLGGKAADATEELQRILDEAGDDLISVDGKQHRPARWVVHQILSKLPPDVLKTYRDRIDEPARRLLEVGRRDHDVRPLWQLLDRFFVSRAADEGSLLLGDLLFERGDFRLAELVWKRLLSDAEADVIYPNSITDPAAVRARIALAAVFQGELDRAKEELATLDSKHPGVKGTLASRSATYAEIVKAFLDQPPPQPGPPLDRNWSSFAGDPQRSGALHGPIPIRRAPRPTWSEFIPIEPKFPPPSFRPPYSHPVILNGWVYISDGYHVAAFELKTGHYKSVYSARPGEFSKPVEEKMPRQEPKADPPVCPTLSSWNGLLFARLGHPTLRPGSKLEDSVIVCFAPLGKPEKDSPPLIERWRIRPPVIDGKPSSAWEGAPLVANGRLWAAFARFEGGRVVHGVACYDPADPDAAPERPAWVVEVADSTVHANQDAHSRSRPELLTLAGRNIVLCTNAGAVIALDAATGHRAWAVQYQRSPRRIVDANRSPDPAPAVVVGGRVFIAPADAEHVWALDAETGAELWESGVIEGGEILGVARHRLIVTSTGPVRGIRGLSVVTGSHQPPEGWLQTTGLLSFGRGIVSDDAIVWPSRAGLFFLDPPSGGILASLKTLGADPQLFGNLAFADGWLVVVTPNQVWAYQTDEPPYQRPSDPTPGGQFQTLMDRAERELAAGHRNAAIDRFLKGDSQEFVAGQRAWSAARLLSLGLKADPPPELKKEWLLTSDGEFATLGALIDRKAGRAATSRSLPGVPYQIADRKPLDASRLDADAAIASTLRLPPGSLPLIPIAGAQPAKHAFILTPRELLAVAFEGGEPKRFAAGEFTHAAETADGFLAAGCRSIALYGSEREPRWFFRVPDTDPLPGASLLPVIRVNDPPPVPELSSFAFAGDWLFARLGDRHLIAFDLKAGVVAWVLGTQGQRRYEPNAFPTAPRFTPHFLVTERVLAVQLSDGRRWLVQSSTGRVWGDENSTFKDGVPSGFGAKTAAVPWLIPPIEMDGAIAFPDGPGLVRLNGHSANRTYLVEGDSSLAGEPPQLHRIGEALFVAVRRNYGVELDRIEPSLARSAWNSGSVFLDAGRIDLAAADADPLRLYIPAGQKLLAFGLDDGKSAWEADLPHAGKWIVHAGRKVVIAHPAKAIAEEPFERAVRRLRGSLLRDPQPRRLPWLTAALYDSWTDRTVPVLLFDPETGKRLSTIRIPAFGPTVAAWFDGDHALVATGDRICWVK